MTFSTWRIMCAVGVVGLLAIVGYLVHRLIDPGENINMRLVRGIKFSTLSALTVAGIVIALDVLNVIRIPAIAITLVMIALPPIIIGTLQPLVPGLMIVAFKPYRVGQDIEVTIEGVVVKGRVLRIPLDATYVYTDDGRVAILPNFQIRQGALFRLPTTHDHVQGVTPVSGAMPTPAPR